MNYSVILHLHSIVKHFLPDYVPILGRIGAHYVQQLLYIHRLQLVEVPGHVPLLHELCDLRITLPVVNKCGYQFIFTTFCNLINFFDLEYRKKVKINHRVSDICIELKKKTYQHLKSTSSPPRCKYLSGNT